MTGDFRVAVSQISGICTIYGPLITFACHRVLKNGYLTRQFPQILPSIHPWSLLDVFKQLFFVAGAIVFRLVTTLEAYLRTSGESNHHR